MQRFTYTYQVSRTALPRTNMAAVHSHRFLDFDLEINKYRSSIKKLAFTLIEMYKLIMITLTIYSHEDMFSLTNCVRNFLFMVFKILAATEM